MSQRLRVPKEYSNALGFVVDDFFCIKGFGDPISFALDSVLKVKFVKQRNKLFNLLFLNLSILFMGALFYFKTASFILQAFLFLMTIGFILLTFLLKKYSYEVIVFTKATHATRIKITKKHKGHAVDMVRFISRIINKRS